MKMSIRTYIIFLLLCINNTVLAQNIKVEKFEFSTFSAKASTTGKDHQDSNGQPCAMIKVQFPYSDVVFTDTYLESFQYETGEYWVYMYPGAKTLTIKHPKMLPLKVNFGDYGHKTLKSKETFEMVLSSDLKEYAEQVLTIHYQPTNAIVVVDGNMVSGENGIVKLTLPAGEHSYTVAAEGYAGSQGTYNLQSNVPGVIYAYLQKLGASDPVVHTSTLDVRLLADSNNGDSETTDFADGDNLYVYLNAPRAGYLTGYLIDPVSKVAVRILPYYTSNEEVLFVYPDKPNVFFPESTNDGFILTATQSVEHNSLFFIFSPNEFPRSNMERRDPDTGLSQMSKSEFDKWLKRIQQRDPDMSVVEKSIVIRKNK